MFLYLFPKHGSLSHKKIQSADGTGYFAVLTKTTNESLCMNEVFTVMYRGADKSLARPGRKQATATEDFDVHISYL
jgi:hypothetical protein